MEYPAALACFISGECRLRNGERRTGAINGSPENRGRVTAEVNVQEYRRATGEIGQPAAIFCIVLADCDAHQARRTLLRAIHGASRRSEEHTSELQSRENLVCRLLLEKKK